LKLFTVVLIYISLYSKYQYLRATRLILGLAHSHKTNGSGIYKQRRQGYTTHNPCILAEQSSPKVSFRQHQVRSTQRTHLSIKVAGSFQQIALLMMIESSSRLTCDCLDRIQILFTECPDLVQDLSLALTLLLGKIDGHVDSNG
jgi:hypothetical protein